jgi:hypothetical protein
MTPQQYFDEIVAPSAEEYFSDPTSVRRATICCILLLHIYDYLKHSGYIQAAEARKYFTEISSECAECQTVYDVAIGAKHAAPKTSSVTIEHLTPKRAERFADLNLPWGEMKKPWADCVDRVEIDTDGKTIDLRVAIRSTLEYFRGKLQARC